MGFIYAAVRENNNICAVVIGLLNIEKQPIKNGGKRGVFIVKHADNLGFQVWFIKCFDFF